MEKYVRGAVIGKGSFGCAYLATRRSDPNGKQYVIKEIRMDPRDQQSAMREAKLLAALDHPNIIACKESFLLPGLSQNMRVLCIVTEFADGGDLRKRLTQHTATRSLMPESAVLDIFVQTCLALKHLHDRKIIHRDIKPENIFLMRSNVVKLGDLGVATVLSNTLACAETLTGTPYYTSPEIVLEKKYNHKTDVWSLGCVLYEMITLTHAFNGRSQRQLFDNIVRANYVPIASACASWVGGSQQRCSVELEALASEMLRKNPRDRPSVNQLLRKPIVMTRIQKFLSDRAVADELNHTVLHGHHIFQKKTPAPVATPPSVVRQAERVLVEKKSTGTKPPSVRAAAIASPQVIRKAVVPKPKVQNPLLRRSKSFKKPVVAAVVSPVKKRVVPTPRTGQLPAKEALIGKRVIAKPNSNKQNDLPPPPPPTAGSLNLPDRIAAFNAQWQAQRHNLIAATPQPVPVAAKKNVGNAQPKSVVVSEAVVQAAMPPPPPARSAVIRARNDAVQQREAMRKVIQDRKRELKKAIAPGKSPSTVSPLDDPIILVQNLPDYETNAQRQVIAPEVHAQASALPPPPPISVETIMTTMGSATEPTGKDLLEKEDEVAVAVPPVNLEFERMVLQLKSVVESGSIDDDDDDDGDGDEEESPDDQPTEPIPEEERDELSTSTLPPSYSALAPLTSIKISVLEDRAFGSTLCALLATNLPEDEQERLLESVPAEHKQPLVWMRKYIRAMVPQ